MVDIECGPLPLWRFNRKIFSSPVSNIRPLEYGTGMHSLWKGIDWVIGSHHPNAPDCMEPLGNVLLLTLFRDKSLQSTELFVVSWFITFGIMEY